MLSFAHCRLSHCNCLLKPTPRLAQDTNPVSVIIQWILATRDASGRVKKGGGPHPLGKVYAMSVHIPSLLQEMADNVPGAGSTMIFDRINQVLSNLV